MIGEPDAGKPHVRFDEGVQETCDIAARLRPTLPEPPVVVLHYSDNAVLRPEPADWNRPRVPVFSSRVHVGPPFERAGCAIGSGSLP